jgi:glutamine amidotransferase
MIAVVDAGLGNIGSLLNMLDHLGIPARPARTPADLAEADRLILPGVGAFDHGMARLRGSGLLPALEDRVLRERTPVLGICLGMQLLGLSSEEGVSPGLGWVPARSRRFDFGDNPARLRIPHMGWNDVRPATPGGLLDLGHDELGEGPRFYFVHSYHVVCDDPADISGICDYGVPFTAALARGHIQGVQFHPEKSHLWGKRLLSRFAAPTSFQGSASPA